MGLKCDGQAVYYAQFHSERLENFPRKTCDMPTKGDIFIGDGSQSVKITQQTVWSGKCNGEGNVTAKGRLQIILAE